MDNNIRTVNLPPGLYLVATPIGNLRDITLRALDTLSAVDAIACEDTRVTAKLLNAYGIKKPLIIYNDHASDHQRASVLDAVAKGQSVALVSDAGTPLVSDPGYRLVREAFTRGLTVTALPGASAVLTGLQLSGLPSDSFSFIGFLPAKAEARKKRLREWAETSGTLIVYETGPRLEASLSAMADILGDRQAAVTRELTKLYEESRRGSLNELLRHYQKSGAPKGEIVIVIAAGEDNNVAPDLDKMLQQSLRLMSVRDAAAHVATATGLPKKDVYARALELAADDHE